MSKISNGPILISSQPLQSIDSSWSSYATGLSAKASIAIKTLMDKSGGTSLSKVNRHESPAAKHRYRQTA